MGDAVAAGLVLIGMPEVRQELNLNDRQAQQADDLLDKMREQQREAMGDFNPAEFFQMNEEERQQRVAEFRQHTTKLMKKADSHIAEFLDGPQSQRFAELRLQFDGAISLSRPEGAKKLDLTSVQKKMLKHLQDSALPPANFGPGNPGSGPPDFRHIEKQRQQRQQEMLAILTGEQKSKWDALLGKPFQFPTPQFGPGGPGGVEQKLVDRFDDDGDHRLNSTERQTARASLKRNRSASAGRGPAGPFGGGFGPPGGPRRENRQPPQAGARVSPKDVRFYPEAKLYDPSVLRTLFLDFENEDWEAELSEFHNSDVEVPATLTVDGVEYPEIGVHFRGMSSYMMVPAGFKRSLNLSLDFVDAKQRLYGYKTLNLLNCHEDPSCLSTVLYSQIARKHIPAPQANFVRVVINGEDWGVYVNVQQFNKEFLAENYDSAKGARWKVRGSPGGGGGLDYVGDKIDDYRRRYEIKSEDSEQSWRKLVEFCRTLSETPAEELPAAIEPILDVDSTLWFLALDNTLINNDGYWVRASDYSIFLDSQEKFHVIPHDMNEAFQNAHPMGFGPPGGGPRSPRGPGDAERREAGNERRPRELAMDLDPLIGLDDSRKPLRSKLLAVPEYRRRYLQYVRELAVHELDWANLGPVVAGFRSLIDEPLHKDTRKLESYDAFLRVTASDATQGQGRETPLRVFADRRRAYLLSRPEIEGAAP
ncbi:MAG: CotH kinase family protein [Planctomycetaceae bacterium]